MPRDLYCLGVLNPNPRPRTFSRPQLRNFNQRRRQAARSFHHNQQRSYRPLEGTEHPVEELLAPRTHPLLLNLASQTTQKSSNQPPFLHARFHGHSHGRNCSSKFDHDCVVNEVRFACMWGMSSTRQKTRPQVRVGVKPEVQQDERPQKPMTGHDGPAPGISRQTAPRPWTGVILSRPGPAPKHRQKTGIRRN
jgi:hypothetical protein